MSIRRKRCSVCKAEKPLTNEHFARNWYSNTGFRSYCKACDAETKRIKRQEKREQDAADRRARLDDPFQPLKAVDFDVGALNDGRTDPKAAKEKRQEYSKAMGEVLSETAEAAIGGADSGDLLDALSDKSVRFLTALSEQEKRFGNRRHARSFSIAMAHELMAMRLNKDVIDRYFRAKVAPKGWAKKKPTKPAKRTVVLLLSDLHFGADLGSLDEPMPYRAIEEARRLEFIVRQAADYKPQYRESSELLLILAGDVIQGMLLHDMRDGIPIVEQKAVFWKYLTQAIGYLASAYPRVRVVCQPGNHGRDKARHPGRATSRKWDGHEWEMYYGLSQMVSSLPNVVFEGDPGGKWPIPFRAVSIVDLYGSKLLVTHGDTEVAIAHPLKGAATNAALMDNINSTQRYGCSIDAACFGHWHYPVYVPGEVRLIHNGALVPPDGYSRTIGANYAQCGQWLWEAVEGYPVGDARFIYVNESQDRDESLGSIITPFRFEAE